MRITQILGEKIVLQMAQMIVPAAHSDQGQAHSFNPNNKSGGLLLPTLASSPSVTKMPADYGKTIARIWL